jgi:hypothetical protein
MWYRLPYEALIRRRGGFEHGFQTGWQVERRKMAASTKIAPSRVENYWQEGALVHLSYVRHLEPQPKFRMEEIDY